MTLRHSWLALDVLFGRVAIQSFAAAAGRILRPATQSYPREPGALPKASRHDLVDLR
jgi:hypothetical protein